MDADALWRRFADHLARLYAGVANPTIERGSGWLAVLSNEQHTDVNICVLLSDATRRSSEAVVRVLDRAEVPGVVSVSSSFDHDTVEPLRAAGLVAAPSSEPLMWLDSPPPRAAAAFDVRRAATPQELSRAIEVAAEAHVIDGGLLTRLLTRDVHADEDVTTWIAWSGEDAASVVWVTRDSQVGVWQMMTPPRHRRRGAGRAVLTTALDDLWNDETEGAFLWASPAGRPLYERVGFTVVDERRVWVLGGDEAANLAIGHPAERE
jgi:GNAT superfamily N-acetyltransferase